MKNNKRLMAISIGLVFISALLIGCGNQQNPGTSEDEQKSEGVTEQGEGSEERVVTDALGNEVPIPVKPERVIASYLEDHLVALGITPVAQWSVNDGASVQHYLQDDLQGVPLIPFDLPFEAVTSFEPDLIIVGSPTAVEGGKYEQYAKIAPTFVLGNEETTDWRKELLKVGELFGERDKAEEVLHSYEQKAKEAKEKIIQSVGEQSAAAIWIVNKTVFMVSETASSGTVLYEELGLTVPPLVKEVSASSTDDWSQVSLEKLAELDADHLFLINSDTGDGAEMLDDPLWANIPAVKNGNIHEFEQASSWLYNGSIAYQQIMDDVVEVLSIEF